MKMYGVVDGKDFYDWLTEKSLLMDKGLGEVLEDEASYLAEAAARLTPPHSGTMSLSESWAVQKKAGHNATLRDLRRVYVSSASLAKQIREQDADAAKGFSKAVRQGNVREAQRLLYAFGMQGNATDQMGSFDPAWHRRMRNSRGRVAKNARQMIVTDQAVMNAYIRMELKKVGSLKRGWWLAGNQLKRKPKIAAWVKKASQGSGGSVVRTRRRVNPYIRLVNSTPYAGRVNTSSRFLAMAINSRTLALANKTKAMAKKHWRKGGGRRRSA